MARDEEGGRGARLAMRAEGFRVGEGCLRAGGGGRRGSGKGYWKGGNGGREDGWGLAVMVRKRMEGDWWARQG